MTLFLTVSANILWLVNVLYSLSGVALKLWLHPPLRGTLNTVWFWCKWPALIQVIAQPSLYHALGNPWTVFDVLSTAVGLAVWWWLRDAGSDDWKNKLKAKATAVVRVFERRLVITPRPA